MTAVVVAEAAVIFSKVAGLVESKLFQDVLPILASTLAKLDANPAGASVLGAQFMADVFPLLDKPSSDVLANVVNLFAAILNAKIPVEAPPAISGAINTALQGAGAAAL